MDIFTKLNLACCAKRRWRFEYFVMNAFYCLRYDIRFSLLMHRRQQLLKRNHRAQKWTQFLKILKLIRQKAFKIDNICDDWHPTANHVFSVTSKRAYGRSWWEFHFKIVLRCPYAVHLHRSHACSPINTLLQYTSAHLFKNSAAKANAAEQ